MDLRGYELMTEAFTWPWSAPPAVTNLRALAPPLSEDAFSAKNQALVKRNRRLAREREKELSPLTPAGILSKAEALPEFLRHPLLTRIYWLRQNRPPEQYSAFLGGTVMKALTRLDEISAGHGVRSNSTELAAYWFRRWKHLPTQTRRQVLTWGSALASQISEMFFTECRALKTELEDISDKDLLWLYRHLGAEMRSLRIRPPHWRALNKRFDKLLCLSALARMMSADWWGRQIWRLRNDWRECQLRAIGQIHRRRNPYVSHDALLSWQEQRRKNRQFIESHQLEDEDGNTASLEAMVLASVSNPAIRRHELMARMQGVELVAMSRGDTGLFLTITCPSKYHSNNHSGHANPKWNGATPSDAQKYLCKVWGRATAKLKRHDLRPYGFRVAEPHHDSTPHWHALIFLPPNEVKPALAILRDYFTKEDRAELGKNTAVRFKAKKMDPKKGSATAYVAKYISKNIDGYALEGEIDKETGRPLRETARLAMAWASQHRLRQFQPVGQPPVTVYRELRKLSNQLTSLQIKDGTYRRGNALLPDPLMDAIAAAADAGCFATYIEKQGGVLIPRECYVVHMAYEEKEEPNAYGDFPRVISGIWCPHLGEMSRQSTRLKRWTIRKKQPDKKSPDCGFSDLQDGPAVPWSSVNNSTGAQKSHKPREEVTDLPTAEIRDITSLTPKERRAALRRMRSLPPVRNRENSASAGYSQSAHPSPPPPQLAARAREALEEMGIHASERLIDALSRGSSVHTDKARKMFMNRNGGIKFVNLGRYCKKCSHEINENNEEILDGCEKCKLSAGRTTCVLRDRNTFRRSGSRR